MPLIPWFLHLHSLCLDGRLTFIVNKLGQFAKEVPVSHKKSTPKGELLFMGFPSFTLRVVAGSTKSCLVTLVAKLSF